MDKRIINYIPSALLLVASVGGCSHKDPNLFIRETGYIPLSEINKVRSRDLANAVFVDANFDGKTDKVKIDEENKLLLIYLNVGSKSSPLYSEGARINLRMKNGETINGISRGRNNREIDILTNYGLRTINFHHGRP
jgi:hypothetical protein